MPFFAQVRAGGPLGGREVADLAEAALLWSERRVQVDILHAVADWALPLAPCMSVEHYVRLLHAYEQQVRGMDLMNAGC